MNIKAKTIVFEGKPRIALYFEKDLETINSVKQIAGARWSFSKQFWHIPDTFENRIRFSIEPPPTPYGGTVEIEKFRSWLRSRRYSENTIRTYCEALFAFLGFFGHKPSKEITNDDIIFFNNDFILKRKLSNSYQNQVVNAIKLYFQTIEDRTIDIDLIHRPKRAKTLPSVLSKEEVKLLLSAPQNIKHRAMLAMVYSCGLRRGELLNLKPIDIDSKRNIVMIRCGKGKKDRIVPLSPRVLELLREYYISYRPKTWLFEGNIKGQQYDPRSVSEVVKRAARRAKIKKPVTLHWLRHSYATHLLESGTDLRYIQEILGHSSSRTTEIYTHVSTRGIQSVRSPYDDL